MSDIVRPVGKIELSDVLDAHEKSIKLGFHCHAIGKIDSFNAENQTCRVSIAYKKLLQVNGENVLSPYPILIDCPVIIMSGGASGITFPIAQGDDCFVMFNDRDIDNWFSGDYENAPNTSRLHSISDGIVIVGLKNLQNSIASYDAENLHLFNDQAKVKITPSKIIVENNSQNLNTILQDILTQLQDLTSQLSSLTVTGVTSGPAASGPPSNAAAITAIGSQLSTLATNLGELLG